MSDKPPLEMEIDRLRETKRELLQALKEFSAAFNNRNETTSLYAWNDRMKLADAHAVRAIGRATS